MITLITILILLVALGLVAVRRGFDSRDGHAAQSGSGERIAHSQSMTKWRRGKDHACAQEPIGIGKPNGIKSNNIGAVLLAVLTTSPLVL